MKDNMWSGNNCDCILCAQAIRILNVYDTVMNKFFFQSIFDIYKIIIIL